MIKNILKTKKSIPQAIPQAPFRWNEKSLKAATLTSTRALNSASCGSSSATKAHSNSTTGINMNMNMSMSTAAAENTAIHFLDPAKSGRNATAHSLDDDKSLIGLTGGEIFHEMMLRHDVKVVFGYPGGAILPVYDAIYNSEYFDFVLPRHEQGAGHMAEGYLSFVNKSHHEYI